MANIDYNQILNQIASELPIGTDVGKKATYIPELANVDPYHFGISLQLLDGSIYQIGDANTLFSIQSISKVFAFAKIFPLVGNSIFRRIGVEPSGNPFNSLTQLENEKGIPRNPFINAGALVVTDMLINHFDNPLDTMLQYIRKLANNPSIGINERVATSEMLKKDRNAALCHFMKSFGNIRHDVEKVLKLYFDLCAVEMSCSDLARAFATYANGGKMLGNEEEVLNKSQTKRLNALMLTCGFYDEAGEFAFEVGLPGKSGVGGGIAALLPGQFGIAVWSPQLNVKGNSTLGMQALERFTTLTGLSIF